MIAVASSVCLSEREREERERGSEQIIMRIGIIAIIKQHLLSVQCAFHMLGYKKGDTPTI